MKFTDTDEKITLKWLGTPQLAGCKDDSLAEVLLEDRFNVEIEPLFYEEMNFNDKKTSLMASGEIPDLIYELDPAHMFNGSCWCKTTNLLILAEKPEV